MTRVQIATLVLFAATTFAALAVARRDKRHRPVAAYLAALLILDICGHVLAAMSPPGNCTEPYTGAARVLSHLDQSRYLGSILALPAMFMAVFLRRKPWIIGGIFVIGAMVLAALYPGLRGGALLCVYSAVELGAVLASGGFFVMWLASPRVAEDGLSVSVMSATALASANIVVCVMPQLVGSDILATWPVAVGTHAVVLAIVLILQLRLIWQDGERAA